MTILDQILATKREEIVHLQDVSFSLQPRHIPDVTALFQTGEHLHIIAEVKRASPSKGIIASQVNVIEQAQQYEAAGASVISVLTDETYFKGSIEDLKQIAAVVNVPLLCKDFIIDERQIDRAYAAGASVILLIVAALSQQRLQALFTYAKQLGLNVLVEVHTLEEYERALSIHATFIGVNNRDLKTFTVDLAQTEAIASRHDRQSGSVLISESGIRSPYDAKRLAAAGVHGLLVGETLMRSEDVAHTLKGLQVER